MKQLFDVIVIDPPFSFADHLQMSDVKRGSLSQYSTLSIEEIKSLPIKDVSNPDGALLALWVPSALLNDGLEIMKTWGFEQKQTYVWVKSKVEPFKDLYDSIKELPILKEELSKKTIKNTIEEIKKECNLQLNNFLQFGMGRLFRNCHEICLIGINNNGIYKKLQDKSQRTISFAPSLKHSQKPEHLQASLEKMFPDAKYLEVFARRQRDGWLCIGNENYMTKNENITISLKKLIEISSPEYTNIMSFCHDQQKMFELWQTISIN